jgi:NADH:ubiquinone oxidoreductase subunit C
LLSNPKLLYIYSLHKIPFIFLHHKAQRLRTVNLLVGSSSVFYVASHTKFCTASYSGQLCDILAYELPISNAQTITNMSPVATRTHNDQTVVIYNFHSFHTQNRLYLFSQNLVSPVHSRFLNLNSLLDSITELFSAANWLEREVAELHGVYVSGKKDVRNLMLQYGDSSNPFKKLFPTIGVKEMVYDIVKDTLVQVNCTVQA